MAGLAEESSKVARESLKIFASEAKMDAATRSTVFRIRVWVDEEEAILTDWLKWVRESVTSAAWQDPGPAHGYYQVRNFDAAKRVAEATWDLLKSISDAGLTRLDGFLLNQFRFPAGWYLYWNGDAEKAERSAREAIAEGHETWWMYIADIAIHRGEPSPPELMESLAKRDPEDPSLDYDRYHIAREAAARGDEGASFSNLERALACWYNPPLGMVDAWERDDRWGDLREHPEFKRLFAEKRKRIGPIYGSLWHFPGWVGIPVDVRRKPT